MKKGFWVNIDDCVGCRSCQVACKDKNNLLVGQMFRKVETYEAGTYPNAQVYHFASTCNHCESPACVANCPTGAMQIDEEDGTVQHDDSTCIGCGTCAASCPYGVPWIDEETSLARKCDACKSLRGKGEEPACTGACPMQALKFGDIEELRSACKDGVDKIAVLPDPATKPSVCINAKKVALQENPRLVEI